MAHRRFSTARVSGDQQRSYDLAGNIVNYGFTPQQQCLLGLSRNTWRRRGAAKRTGLSFNEETVTEGLLLDLKSHFPGHVEIVPFSKQRERHTGADWAWAFVGPGGCGYQGMLVPAKRLDDKDDGYTCLYKDHQIGQLIATGKRYGLPPVYAFYNHLSDDSRIPPHFCGTLTTMYRSCPEVWGVSLASAISIRRKQPDKSFDCHRNHSIPLHCLLCSHGTGLQYTTGSAGAATDALSHLFSTGTQIGDYDLDFVLLFEPAAELPDLFQEAERLHRNRESDDLGMIADFSSRFPDLAGVVVVRDREDAELDFGPTMDIL